MDAIADLQSEGDLIGDAGRSMARTLTFTDIPEETRVWARQCLLDYIACGIAGASDELTEILHAELSEQGGRESATILDHHGRLPAASASTDQWRGSACA